MSLESWKEEFYPIEAEHEKADPVGHSLRKWQGLRKENLEKHGVVIDCERLLIDTEDSGGKGFRVGADSCALCEIHYNSDEPIYYHGDEDDEDDEDNCGRCPLKVARGGVSCDMPREGEKLSPWTHFVRLEDPEPMIVWLERAKNNEFHPNE